MALGRSTTTTTERENTGGGTMRRILTMALVVLGLSAVATTSGLAFQEDVDWMWGDTNPTVRSGCKSFVVKAGPPKILRGKMSGRGCLERALPRIEEVDS